MAEAEEALRGNGCTVGTADWLAPSIAVDLPFDGSVAEGLADTLRAALSGLMADVNLQPSAGRRKKLLIADMDSTVITSESLDDLATYAGIGDKIAPITARAMRGELDFEEALTGTGRNAGGAPIKPVGPPSG